MLLTLITQIFGCHCKTLMPKSYPNFILETIFLCAVSSYKSHKFEISESNCVKRSKTE